MPVGSNLLTLVYSSFHLRHLTVLRLARYALHPIAFFSSAAVRPHFAFNRSNFVFRSRVANHFHAEAAAKEESAEALNSFPGPNSSHPWPEWSKLSGLLVEKGYSDRCISSGEDDDSFSVDDDLPEEFLRSAKACLGFARDRPDILRLLTKKNIEAVVANGSPFLFKNGENSSRRMKLFFNGEGSSELEPEKAETVDAMRYLLSYVYGSLSSSDVNVLKSDELVEKSVRKLLGELYNLSGTVWKSKSVDAYLMEPPLSNEQFSRSSGQDTEMRSINSNYTKFVAPSFVASESQSSGPSSLRSPVNQNQCSEEAPVGRTYDDSGQPPSHFGNNYNSTDNGEYTGKPNQRSGNSWRNGNTSYDGSTTNSFASHEKSWSTQPPYNSSYNANSTPPFSNSLSNNSSTAFYGDGPTTSSPSRPSPDNYWNDHRSSYHRDGINSTPPSNNSSGNSSSFFYGSPTSSSSQPLSNSWDNRLNSSPPSGSTSRSNDNPVNSYRSARDPWSDYNTSYAGNTTNSTPPSSNRWDNNSRSTDYRSNYNTGYDGFVTKPTQTYSNPENSSFTSNHGFTENLTQPPSNSSNSTNTSYGASSADNSSQPLPNFTNKYNASPKISAEPIRNPWNTNNSYAGSTPDTYHGFTENSAVTSNHGFTENLTQPPSNSSNSTNTSYGASSADNSSQPLPNFTNKYNASPKISAEPIRNPWNTNNSYAGSTPDTHRGYAENSTHPSSNPWNSNTTTYSGGPTSNPAQLPDRNSWNNTSESWSGGFPQANIQKNATYGYSGKSLEGSCVKEPDPLDMSEEAKAERWFRRAAQIKDISELSQIPDEDFPQIMPMRKGVNRFVVSKRKTPLERRLASHQYRRNLPVVSSEPGKEPAVGESTAYDGPDSGL